MSFFSFQPTTLSFLVCSDLDGVNASRMAEYFVPSRPQFDGIILGGPFCHSKRVSLEDKVVSTADIATIIAHFENISCRVMFVPGSSDPLETAIQQMNLTPNSVNISARCLDLSDSAYIMGFTELIVQDEDVQQGIIDADASMKSNQSIDMISEMIAIRDTQVNGNLSGGIFVVNFKYAHTLNALLFHLMEQLSEIGIKLCVICPDDEPSQQLACRLPKKLGDMHILVPSSLRNGGNYSIATLQCCESDGRWMVSECATYTLLDGEAHL